MSLVASKKPKSFHRKIYGSHHRHSRGYLKTYWPYIPIAFIVISGLFINSWLLKSSSVLGASQDYSSSSLLSDTNADRASDNEKPLDLNSQLSSAAQAKASDMVNNNYWSHTSPSGKTPWDLLTASGYQYQSAGENLAYGFSSASATTEAWMNSTEHRANILNANFENVGFGVAQSNNYLGQGPKVIVVAEYAQPVLATTASSTTNPVVPLTSQNSESVSRLQLFTSPGVFWTTIALTALAGAGVALIVVRHFVYFKKLLSGGEAFIIQHPFLDIACVFVLTYGLVITRSAGFIN